MKPQQVFQLINLPKTWLTVSNIFQKCPNSSFSFFLVNNLRLKVDRASIAIEDLASKGPLKPEGLRGLNEDGYAEYLKGEDITVTDGLKMMPP